MDRAMAMCIPSYAIVSDFPLTLYLSLYKKFTDEAELRGGEIEKKFWRSFFEF